MSLQSNIQKLAKNISKDNTTIVELLRSCIEQTRKNNLLPARLLLSTLDYANHESLPRVRQALHDFAGLSSKAVENSKPIYIGDLSADQLDRASKSRFELSRPKSAVEKMRDYDSQTFLLELEVESTEKKEARSEAAKASRAKKARKQLEKESAEREAADQVLRTMQALKIENNALKMRLRELESQLTQGMPLPTSHPIFNGVPMSHPIFNGQAERVHN
jgi:hypothetical protein